MKTRLFLLALSVLLVPVAFSFAQSGGASVSCVTLVRALSYGSTDATTGGEVTKLQQFLKLDVSIYPEGLVTGYFGPATLRAVKRWQGAHGIASIGLVGPLTRAALMCKVTTTPPVTPAPPTQPSTTTPPATTIPPVTPPPPAVSCNLVTDKETYSFGDRVNISWTTSGAMYVTFPENRSSELWLPVLGTYTPQSSLTVTANTSGSAKIVMVAYGNTASTTCTKTVLIQK